MIRGTKQADGNWFETFKRMNLFAKKRVAEPIRME